MCVLVEVTTVTPCKRINICSELHLTASCEDRDITDVEPSSSLRKENKNHLEKVLGGLSGPLSPYDLSAAGGRAQRRDSTRAQNVSHIVACILSPLPLPPAHVSPYWRHEDVPTYFRSTTIRADHSLKLPLKAQPLAGNMATLLFSLARSETLSETPPEVKNPASFRKPKTSRFSSARRSPPQPLEPTQDTLIHRWKSWLLPKASAQEEELSPHQPRRARGEQTLFW